MRSIYFTENEQLKYRFIGIKAANPKYQKSIYSILEKQKVKVSKDGLREVYNKSTRNFELSEQELKEFKKNYKFKNKPKFYLVFSVEENGKVLDDYYISNNEFILKLKKKVSPKEIRDLLKDKHLYTIKPAEKRRSDYFIVKIRYSNYSDMLDKIATLSKTKKRKLLNLIEYIHPNFMLQSTQRTQEEQNCIIDVNYYVPNWLQATNAVAAKNYIYTNNLYEGEGRTIIPLIVVDQGVNKEHPEFTTNQFGKGFNAFDKSNNSDPDFSIESHGTAVSGLILSSNFYQGILGINPRLTMLYNIKIFSKQYLDYEESARSDLIKHALETYPQFQQDLPRVYNFSCKLLNTQNIIEGLNHICAQHKSLLVCAAGNITTSGNTDIVFPARLAHTICVGSVDVLDNNDFKLSPFTCTTGTRRIDICAPGNNIQTTSTGNKYCTFSGTSFATPLVSGLAAMIWLINNNLSPAEVKQIILDTAQNTFDGYDPETMGAGVINCLAAVEEAERSLVNT